MLGIWLAGMMATATETMEVPVADLDGWTTLEFNGIPANDVATGNGSLRIVVRESASPLVYRFDECLRITGINVAAKWTGSIELPTGADPG